MQRFRFLQRPTLGQTVETYAKYMKLNVMMASRSQSHVIRLNLRKSSNAEEVHDIVVEELIRAGKENTATDRLKVHQNGDSSVIRNIPLNSASIKSVAVSPPFIGIVLSNGKVCRYKICEESDDSVDTCATGEVFMRMAESYFVLVLL